MEGSFLVDVGVAVISAAAAAGGAWAAVRTEMKYLRRDIDRNSREIERVEERRHNGEGILHERVSRLNERMTAAGVNGRESER